MPQAHNIVSHIYIKVDGEDLRAELLGQLLEVTVDQQVHVPGMFTIRLADPDLQLLDKGPFDLAKAIEIAGKGDQQAIVPLFKGEITALEPEFGEGMIAELVVRGYDRLHRLFREVKSKTYLNIKDSDLAQQMAEAAGLTATVEATKTVYDHLYQNNQSDLAFLMHRAWRIGYECFVEDEKLIFRKPVTAQPKVSLAWGKDLLSFRPRLTVADQVAEVQVKGWDVQKKAVIIGRSTQGQLYPKVKPNGADAAQKFGKSKQVIVDHPVVSQAEANTVAAARLDEISGVFIEAEGTAFRRPEIKAGQKVKLEALGERLSGAYLVTSATHVYTSGGFTTHFSVRGARTGMLSETTAPRMQMDRWPGLVPAIVTNTDDPKQWGRIKVKYPWMSDEDESDWMRIASAGAGPKAGFCITPAVDDEVLVGFVHGDFGQPVALGALWNGKDETPPPTAAAPQGEKPLVRTWHSRRGHHITMHDNADNKILITTKSGHLVTLDDAKAQISIVSKGKLEITLDDNAKEIKIKSPGQITVKADNEIQVEATGNMQLKAGGNLNLEARGNLEMKATGSANLQATAKVAIQAPQISLG